MSNQINLFQVAVEAIIEKDGQILITKRAPTRDHMPNEWETLTGRLNRGESFLDALHREVYEETKLKIKPLMPIDTFHFMRVNVETVGVSYWCKYLGGEIILDTDEQVEYRWVDPEEAIEIIRVGNIQRTIRNFIAHQSNFQELIENTRNLAVQFPNHYIKQDRLLDAMEEMGELAQAMLIVEKRKTTNDPSKQRTTKDIADGLCDLLYNLILLADDYQIDFTLEYRDMLSRLQHRINQGEFKQ